MVSSMLGVYNLKVKIPVNSFGVTWIECGLDSHLKYVRPRKKLIFTRHRRAGSIDILTFSNFKFFYVVFSVLHVNWYSFAGR